jgi:hypothetical protein
MLWLCLPGAQAAARMEDIERIPLTGMPVAGCNTPIETVLGGF